MSCHKQQICDKQMDDTQMDGGLCCILHCICEGGIIKLYQDLQVCILFNI